MKKLYSCVALAFFVLAVSSCNTESLDPNLNSSENGSNTGGNTGGGGSTTDNVLIKKEIVTDETGAVVTYEYTYDGYKLLKITGTDGSLEQYTYNATKLVKRVYDDGTDSGYQEDIFSYDSTGKLSVFLSSVVFNDGSPSSVSRNEYTYNTDNTITVKTYFGDETSQTNLYDTAVITITNGNLVSYSGNAYTETTTFDSKNSPTKNIVADSVLTLAYLEGGVNNELVNRFDDSHSVQTSTSTYTYNSNNYPATSITTLSTGEAFSTQYFY